MDKVPGSPRNDASATSTPPEEPQSPASADLSAGTRREKGRVRFNSIAGTEPPSFLDLSGISATQARHDGASLPPRPRPSVLRGNSYNSVTSIPESVDNDDPASEKALSAYAAQERAQQVAATLLGSRSAPGSTRTSLDSEAETVNSGGVNDMPPGFPNITLDEFPMQVPDINGDAQKNTSDEHRALKTEAYNLVRSHTQRNNRGVYHQPTISTALSSGQITPIDGPKHELYVPPPSEYRPSVLSNLLKLYKPPESTLSPNYPHSRKSEHGSEFTTPGSSGATTPNRRKWYEKNRSQDTLANLVEASARLASAGVSGDGPSATSSRPKRPKHRRSPSGRMLSFGRPRMEDEIRITMHIAETLTRQKYIIKMCKALMLFGAPTHRLEEYLRMTARVLEIDGQFLYLPGCMIISFDDRSTHTTEVKIVRTNQGIDLGKLRDTHEIYKLVLHDKIDLEEAIESISRITEEKDKFHPWLRVLVFGLASATVAPFAFDGQLIDLPICFFLGCLVGTLQIIVAPKSDLYNNVFEITAAVLTSFLSRAFGSIRGGKLFCFSSLAQSSIALILPGWFVLCSALELQSRALVPGSIRMVYAIIYSLFLGFGITVGTALYGLMDPKATSATTCLNPIPTYYRFLFVPLFTMCLAFVNQAKWKQMPVMVVIAFAGHVVNFFSSPKFAASPQIANTLGAFTVGVLANLYSRLRHGVAAAALLPAIFVQVPSGLAATGSLLSGLSTANELNNSTEVVNGTSTVTIDNSQPLDTIVFNVAASMIQIAIGITVGLFLSALVVYPLGKRRSGLWTL
ncbi:DUF1212-domain-containing protein [Annulohypoxylon maeteangense]|uniref:DUF1212-domain-containing protein n=1 Tax=Annulohypoxylon maeteangense TaxID=1927788 RepID=UPI00200887D3|nr:DUF1212-domain-containing protein [Annulohypoxylon maeteangense]KAI0880137.1 DUF1212-domain-containing protein [Annulohypoxylon maeteangense]